MNSFLEIPKEDQLIKKILIKIFKITSYEWGPDHRRLFFLDDVNAWISPKMMYMAFLGASNADDIFEQRSNYSLDVQSRQSITSTINQIYSKSRSKSKSIYLQANP